MLSTHYTHLLTLKGTQHKNKQMYYILSFLTLNLIETIVAVNFDSIRHFMKLYFIIAILSLSKKELVFNRLLNL